MSRYETAIDLGNANASQSQLVLLTGRDKTVLDVGCAAGDTARALVERGCRVSGVDIDAAATEPAREVLDELVIADIERSPLSTHFKAESFDAILFGDVLEHLVDPLATLQDAVGLLAPEGRIIVSIPNIAHGSTRLALLEGRWQYTDTGLLDRTHLRFFTFESVCSLLEDAGLVIEVLHATVLDPMATEVEIDTGQLPPAIVEWVRDQPHSLDYQYVAAARPLRPGEERAPRPVLEPLLAPALARIEDEHSAAMAAERDLRHRLLTQRDHIIGLEAALAVQEFKSADALARAKNAERKFRRVRKQHEELLAELEAVDADRSPRGALKGLLHRVRSTGAAEDAGD